MAIFAMIVSAVFASYTAVTKGAVAGNRAAAEAQRSRVALRTMFRGYVVRLSTV